MTRYFLIAPSNHCPVTVPLLLQILLKTTTRKGKDQRRKTVLAVVAVYYMISTRVWWILFTRLFCFLFFGKAHTVINFTSIQWNKNVKPVRIGSVKINLVLILKPFNVYQWGERRIKTWAVKNVPKISISSWDQKMGTKQITEPSFRADIGSI